jgi:hypothetical protein
MAYLLFIVRKTAGDGLVDGPLAIDYGVKLDSSIYIETFDPLLQSSLSLLFFFS